MSVVDREQIEKELAEKGKQETVRDMEQYCKHIFTLKSGKQIVVLTDADYEQAITEIFTHTKLLQVKGFVLNPLRVDKEIEIRKDEIVSTERIMEFYIPFQVPFPVSEVPVPAEAAEIKDVVTQVKVEGQYPFYNSPPQAGMEHSTNC